MQLHLVEVIMMGRVNIFADYPFGFVCEICNSVITFCLFCEKALCDCEEGWTDFEGPMCKECTYEDMAE